MIATLSKVLIEKIRPAIRDQHPYVVSRDGFEPDIKLNQNESPFDIPLDLKKELLESFLSIPFNRYPKEQPELLRHRLAQHLGQTPDGILVGNGSNELAYTLGLCLIEQNAPVVLPTPMFSLYEKVVRLYGGCPIKVPALSDFHFDVPGLIAAIRKHRPSLTIITTPNNPTGLRTPLADIERLLAETEGFLVVDEAYVEFTDPPSALSLLDRHPNLIIMRTFSKAFGLAGLRIGYMIAHPDVIREFLKSRLPFVVDRLAETVALALLERTEIITRQVNLLKEQRDTLIDAMRAFTDFRVLPSEANFALFKGSLPPDILMKNLANRGILVRNMGGYSELAGYLRVNAGSPEENKEFLSALEDAIRS